MFYIILLIIWEILSLKKKKVIFFLTTTNYKDFLHSFVRCDFYCATSKTAHLQNTGKYLLTPPNMLHHEDKISNYGDPPPLSKSTNHHYTKFIMCLAATDWSAFNKCLRKLWIFTNVLLSPLILKRLFCKQLHNYNR